jgi:hypothetical protein
MGVKYSGGIPKVAHHIFQFLMDTEIILVLTIGGKLKIHSVFLGPDHESKLFLPFLMCFFACIPPQSLPLPLFFVYVEGS